MTLEDALPQLCEEIKDLKASYFSEQGKPGAHWNPLKPKTIKYKKAHKNQFNIDTGRLKNSLTVRAQITDGVLEIACTATHENGDEAIEQLIYEYGRNFLDFTEDEAALIINRLTELMRE